MSVGGRPSAVGGKVEHVPRAMRRSLWPRTHPQVYEEHASEALLYGNFRCRVVGRHVSSPGGWGRGDPPKQGRDSCDAQTGRRRPDTRGRCGDFGYGAARSAPTVQALHLPCARHPSPSATEFGSGGVMSSDREAEG